MESREQEIATAFCPNCARTLRFPRAVLGTAALPALSYYCEECGEAITLPAELDEPPLAAVVS